jgi:anti-sigma factor RsiW
MSDCPNVEIRELLPDYLSGTLSARRREEVWEHVTACDDCAQELALLQLVREAYAEAYAEAMPPVNVGAIVAAIPRRTSRPAMRSWGAVTRFKLRPPFPSSRWAGFRWRWRGRSSMTIRRLRPLIQ